MIKGGSIVAVPREQAQAPKKINVTVRDNFDNSIDMKVERRQAVEKIKRVFSAYAGSAEDTMTILYNSHKLSFDGDFNWVRIKAIRFTYKLLSLTICSSVSRMATFLTWSTTTATRVVSGSLVRGSEGYGEHADFQ